MLPLFLFLLLAFLVPIGSMLARGIADTDAARALPRVTAELKRWDGRELPDESAYAALIADIREAREAGSLASAATRLNYDVAGFRSLLFITGRQLPATLTASARQTLEAIDPKWGERETWAAINSRNSGSPAGEPYFVQPSSSAFFPASTT